MRLRFFRRRQHQKLSSGGDELSTIGLTCRPNDESSGSGSIQSFDPNSYTVDACISDKIPVAVDLNSNDGSVVSRRRVLLLLFLGGGVHLVVGCSSSFGARGRANARGRHDAIEHLTRQRGTGMRRFGQMLAVLG